MISEPGELPPSFAWSVSHQKNIWEISASDAPRPRLPFQAGKHSSINARETAPARDELSKGTANKIPSYHPLFSYYSSPSARARLRSSSSSPPKNPHDRGSLTRSRTWSRSPPHLLTRDSTHSNSTLTYFTEMDSFQQPPRGACYSCGAPGHQARDCPTKGPAKCATTAASLATTPATAPRSLLVARRSATSASSLVTSRLSAPTKVATRVSLVEQPGKG
ncbi:hypothetical protein B0T10DRAFT_312386 [Thelonectria olida]|uniref:CCHC-type domain-containing protein n=1 Tax=Thelonectria olida TaxID=1576542 RepID=A0A9P8W738_9HYPO|nr:hypothetical protein B0T10DRAFT_312386 [Thelonectria olida]